MYSLPSKPEKLSFDWIFDRITQEEVYVHYLGFCALNKKFTSPLRNDAKADCSFFWRENVLFFKDFAQNKVYTCIGIVMIIKSISFWDALDEVYNSFIGNKPTTFFINKKIERKDKEYKDIQTKIQLFTNVDKEYLKSFGLTSDLCKEYKVFSISHYWINGDLKYTYNTYIGYYFNGKWKLYHYKSSNFRFVGNTSHSDLQGYDQLDWTGEVCIITKSMKDVILYRRFGINAVAPHSEALSVWKDKIPVLQKRFAKVIINFDNDNAGIRATNEVLKEFELDVFYLPEEKDISDYYKKFGFNQTKQLLKQFNECN
jgi:hypothetical protein